MKDKDIAKAYCMHWFKGLCVRGKDDAPCTPKDCSWFRAVVQKCHAHDIHANQKVRRRQ